VRACVRACVRSYVCVSVFQREQCPIGTVYAWDILVKMLWSHHFLRLLSPCRPIHVSRLWGYSLPKCSSFSVVILCANLICETKPTLKWYPWRIPRVILILTYVWLSTQVIEHYRLLHLELPPTLPWGKNRKNSFTFSK